jgi:hypothetical protein
MRLSIFHLPLSILLLSALPAAAQPAGGFKPRKSKIPEADIDRAIEKGIAWLKEHKNDDPTGNHGATTEELVFYTLLHGGVPRNDPDFQEFLKRIVDKDPSKTYSAALAAMGLCQLDKAGYQWKLEHLAQFFMDNQCENGQWSYGEPIPLEKKTFTPAATAPAAVASGPGGQMIKPAADAAPLYGAQVKADAPKAGKSGNTTTLPRVKVRQRRKGPPDGDNSNSMYAALGLRACAEGGIEPDPRCIEDAWKWWKGAQHGDGGWGYKGKDSGGTWGGMTVGGIGSLSIYSWMMRKPWQNDGDIAKGFKWLDEHWAVDKNPNGTENDKAHWHYYYLYGLERAGMIYGTDFVVSHIWYDEGAKFLLSKQEGDGSWRGDGGKSRVWDTCFAILFLRRATKPLPPKIYTN